MQHYAQDVSVTYADDLVKEYLAFRGFTQTLKTFDGERKQDKNKSFQSEKIVEQIFLYLHNQEITKCLDYWKYLENKFFSKLDQGFFETIRKLELSIKKYYVVNCIQTGRVDRCREFFDNYANELAKDKEWRDWFVLPFLKNPELQPELEPYFNKTWAEMLYVSLQNFISTALQSIEKPQLLTLESDKRDRNSTLRKKLDLLIHENESLNSKLLAAESYILKLEQEAGINRVKTTNPNIAAQIDQKVNTEEQGTATITGILQNVDDSHFDYERTQGSTLNGADTGDMKRTTLQLSQLKPIYPKKVFSGHKDSITQCAFSGNGMHLASSSRDKTVRVWTMNDNSYHQCFDCGTQVLCLDWNKRNEQLLVCGLNNRKVKILNIESGKCAGEFLTDAGYPRINDLASCPSNGYYFIVSCAGVADQQSQQQTQQLRGMLLGYDLKMNKVTHRFPIENRGAVINTIRFNHNGTMMVTGGNDGFVRIYDVRSQTALMSWRAHEGEVTSVHFSGNETTILSAGSDNRVHQWSAHKTGKVMQTFQLPPYEDDGPPRRLALSEDRSECFLLNSPSMVFSMVQKQATCVLQWNENTGAGRLGAIDWYGSNYIAGSSANSVYMFTADNTLL